MLLPCRSQADATSGVACGATVSTQGAVQPDLTSELKFSQARVSPATGEAVCSPCDVALLARGLCPPGRYRIEYALAGEVVAEDGSAAAVAPAYREVVVYEAGVLTVRLSYKMDTGEVSFMGVPVGQLPQVRCCPRRPPAQQAITPNANRGSVPTLGNESD